MHFSKPKLKIVQNKKCFKEVNLFGIHNLFERPSEDDIPLAFGNTEVLGAPKITSCDDFTFSIHQGPIPETISPQSAQIRSCDPDRPIAFHKR